MLAVRRTQPGLTPDAWSSTVPTRRRSTGSANARSAFSDVRRPPRSRRAGCFVGVRAVARVETKHKATDPASVIVGAVAPRAAQAVADAGRRGPPKAYLSPIFRSRNRTDPFRVSRKMATHFFAVIRAHWRLMNFIARGNNAVRVRQTTPPRISARGTRCGLC